jgi:Tetratricopeptide repeat
MTVNRSELEALGREQLIQEARRYGVRRPEVMTRVELVDEVLRIGTPNPVERKKVRGWLGVARDLLASAVEQGLNLPDAAALIRGDVRFEPLSPVQPPVATVTLAEIYGAQGHFKKALTMLDEVLAKEPEHEAARKLRARLEREQGAGARAPAAGVTAGATAAVFPEEPEPLTPRRLSLQPPPSPVIHDDAEPLTPRRLAKQPPPERVIHDDAEPLTPRRLSKQPPPFAPVIDDDSEPLTPGRLRRDPPSDETAPAAPAAPAGTKTEAPTDDDAVLVRTTPSAAVVYFEVRGELPNGDAPLVEVIEWRSVGFGVERVARQFAITAGRGTVFVEGLSAGAVVRAAVGRKRHGRFKPLAVCAEVTFASGSPTVVWSPRPRKDYAPIAARAAGSLKA